MKAFTCGAAVLSLLCCVILLASGQWTAGLWACCAAIWSGLYAVELP